MKQKDKFLSGEGDNWFDRNVDSFDQKAQIQNAILFDFISRHPNVTPSSVLEIGCSNGWQLNRLSEHYRISDCFGIEPSKKAVENGKQQYPGLDLIQGTADNLPYSDDYFDMVIFGFCLYLCDPEDLFTIAREADRVLQDRGILCVFDFDVPAPYHNVYAHDQSIRCYKMNFANMFMWHPQYSLVEKLTVSNKDITDADQRETFSFLAKNTSAAFPQNRSSE